MTKTLLAIVALATAALFSACTPTATNTAINTTTNTNAVKPAAAAPTLDTLFAMDKAANEAWTKSETKWFDDNLSSKFIAYFNGQRTDKSATVKMVASSKCDIKSMNLTEPAMTKVNDDTYVIVYKGEFDGSCTMDGKTEKQPSPVRAASIWIREGGKWMALWHGETPMMAPTSSPATSSANTNANTRPADKKALDTKAADSKSDSAMASTNKSAASNSNTASPAGPAKSANTDALTALHQQGWEAWKNKDAKWFDAHTTSSLSTVGPDGSSLATKDATIKYWTEGMKCEGVTKVSVTDGHAVSVSPTVELHTSKGTADGKCDGQPNGDLWTTAVYVKEGEAWKLAFMMENPPMPGA